jgi:hypothetical protein
MIKIAHKREVKNIDRLPAEIIEKVTEIATILDKNYGKNRSVDYGLGGYILIAETTEDMESITNQIDLKHNLPEYVDLITCVNGENYTSSLILLSCDYSISLIIPLSLMPKELLMYMGG